MASLILGVGLLAGLSTGAAASTQSGEVGHFLFPDSQTHPEATCAYTSALKLKSIAVRPPSAWWPDRSSANNHEHGTVGWRVIVRSAPGNVAAAQHVKNGPSTKFVQTGVQKATAFEDHPPYDPADAAHFTKRTVSWNGPKDPSLSVQVIVQVLWYKHNGSVMGWQKYAVVNYGVKSPGSSGVEFTNSCPTVLLP